MAVVIDIGLMLTNLQHTFGSLRSLVGSVSYVIGLIFIVRGLAHFKETGHMMNGNKSEIPQATILMIIGSLLIYLPSTIEMGLNTIFASTDLGAASELLSYTAPSGSDLWSQISSVIVDYLKLLGLIAFIRGWVMLSHVGGHQAQPGNVGKGITHIIAGIVLINIVDSVKILATTFGFTGFSGAS